MITRVILFLAAVMFTVPAANAQTDDYTPDVREVLRLIRKDKLDLVLPGAMRDNNVDMWIHVTRAGDQDPMFREFGSTSGYMIFTNDPDEPQITVELNGNIDGINIGEAAPDFELDVIANGSGSFQLSDHLGQIVVLAFFAPG